MRKLDSDFRFTSARAQRIGYSDTNGRPEQLKLIHFLPIILHNVKNEKWEKAIEIRFRLALLSMSKRMWLLSNVFSSGSSRAQLHTSLSNIWFIEINCIAKHNGIIRQRARAPLNLSDRLTPRNVSGVRFLLLSIVFWFHCLLAKASAAVYYVHGAQKWRLFG